jgi:hypothetical protein
MPAAVTGTQNIYENMESKNVSIKIHSHDRNMAVNKFVKETQFTTNQNDLWHAVKAVKKSVSKRQKCPWNFFSNHVEHLS